MWTDLHFRVALVAVAAFHLTLSHGLIRRAGARWTPGRTRAEGPVLAWTSGVSLGVYAVAVLAWLVNPAWLAATSLPLTAAARWCGVPLLALGAGLHLWGARHLAENLSVTIEPAAAPRLVTSGPYRWIRHPLYAGGLLESLGVVALVSDGIVALGAAGFWCAVFVRTKQEEQLLEATFGASYRAYRQRTSGWLPLRGWRRDGKGPDGPTLPRPRL